MAARREITKFSPTRGVPWAVAIVAAGLLVLIQIGAMPSLGDIYTRQSANREHDTINAARVKSDADCEMRHSEVDGSLTEIKHIIRSGLRDQKSALTEQNQRIEKIDARVWRILEEVKR